MINRCLFELIQAIYSLFIFLSCNQFCLSYIRFRLPWGDMLLEPEPILPCPQINGYRNNCKFTIGLDQTESPVRSYPNQMLSLMYILAD